MRLARPHPIHIVVVGLAVASTGIGCSPWTKTVRSTVQTKSTATLAASKSFDDHFRKTLAKIKTAEKSGDFRVAEDGYISLLSNRTSKEIPLVRLGYAELLEREGKFGQALKTARPLVHRSSQFEAIQLYVRLLKKTKGGLAVDSFLLEIRHVPLNGLSISDFEKKGLTARQTLIFVQGTNAEGRTDWHEAERNYRLLLPEHPPSEEFYSHVARVLCAQHRNLEVKPIFAQWFLHSSEKMRAQIKTHWNNMFFDYPSLERQVRSLPGKPTG